MWGGGGELGGYGEGLRRGGWVGMGICMGLEIWRWGNGLSGCCWKRRSMGWGNVLCTSGEGFSWQEVSGDGKTSRQEAAGSNSLRICTHRPMDLSSFNTYNPITVKRKLHHDQVSYGPHRHVHTAYSTSTNTVVTTLSHSTDGPINSHPSLFFAASKTV